MARKKRGYIYVKGYQRSSGRRVKGYYRKKYTPKTRRSKRQRDNTLNRHLAQFEKYDSGYTADSPPRPKKTLSRIRRRYRSYDRKISFIYRHPADKKRKTKQVKLWFVCHDPDQGFSIWEIIFKRGRAMTPSQWKYHLHHDIKTKTAGERRRAGDYYRAFIPYFSETVLEASNVRHGTDWRMVEFIGFTNVI